MLLFRGGEMVHGGDPVLAGTRYVIAAFIFIDEHPSNTTNTTNNNTTAVADPVREGEEENQEVGNTKTFQFSFSFS